MELEPRVAALETDMAALKSEVRTNLATKEDLLHLKLELKDDICELHVDNGKLRNEMLQLRVDVAKQIDRLTWKMFGFFAATIPAMYLIAQLPR